MEATSKQNHVSVFNKDTHFTLLSNYLLSRCTLFHFLLLYFLLLLCFLLKKLFSNPSPIYLIDFSCLKPPSSCRTPSSTFLENASLSESCLDNETIAFMKKILHSSGQSEETCLPPSLHYIPPRTHHTESIKEVHMVLFPIMDDLFEKTNLSPSDINILIFNCGGFCPSPSLTSMIVNKYSMRSDIKTYNISGMGCSASALCIDLAYNLLRVNKNSNAIVLSAESLSNDWYRGKERSKLLLNCLFRMGSAAILLSNKKEASKTAKYKLIRTLRTQRAFDDKAYFSATKEEDSDGKLGFTLNRNIPEVVGEALVSNISILSSQMLSIYEKIWYIVSVKRHKFIKPDIKRVIDHFCLPYGGALKEVGKKLNLGEREIEAALMTLHRFGNQYSSSLWYQLCYLEGKERVHKGEQILVLGVGSGTKCCSVVLKCIRPIFGEAHKGPWFHCIHQYPTY
ncbi:unnamed protein product [Vicia faba]|uniref:3-ketoacyl-CoA synthase n=1 Tax=Vicia faba TaxID=3906 RepID=A0AAV0ZI55_VICFA|nr:unnamed protein product [Vicia faba]